MTRVFISYSSQQDRQVVEQLKRALYEAKFQIVHLDRQPGPEYFSNVASAIRGADIVVVILSRLHSNVAFEAGLAVGAGKDLLLVASGELSIPSELESLPCVRLSSDFVTTNSEIVRRLIQMERPQEKSRQEYVTAEAKLNTFFTDLSYFEAINERFFVHVLIEWFLDRATEWSNGKWFGVSEVDHSIDEGYDFLLVLPKERKIAVEVKKLNRQNRVSINHVRQLQSAMTAIQAKAGMLITTSDFTASALAYAADSTPCVHLFTMDRLLRTQDAQDLLIKVSQNES